MRGSVASVPAVGLCMALLASSSASQGVRVNGPLAPVPALGAEDVLAFRLSPDGSWAIFLADSELEDNRFELFGVPADGSASPRRLNGPLVDGGNLVLVYVDPEGGVYAELPQIAITPANRVVYRADQDVDEVQELYSVPIDGSAPPVELSGTMVAGGDVAERFAVTPDGMRVLFLADRDTDGVRELYSAPIDGGAAPVRLNASPLPGAGFASDFGAFPVAIAPDGLTAVYRLDQATSGVDELWSVPTDGSTSPIRLNAPLVAGGDVSDFQISPDGTQVLYRADQATNDLHELWRVPADGSAPPVRVNGPLDASVAAAFSISPDGTRAVYSAVGHGDGLARHFSATLTGPLLVTALYDRTSPALGFYEAVISPDGARVVLWGDYAQDEVYEVFSVPIDGGSAPLVLNAPLVASGDVGDQGIGNSFRITPDGSRVVYWADQVTVGEMELWSVPIDRSADPVRLNGDLVPGGRTAFPFRFSPDGGRVVYVANQRPGRGFELWSAPSQGGAPPIRLSGRPVPGGNVQVEQRAVLHTGFDVSSDGELVVYRADQSSNELFSLWSVPLDRRRPPRELNAPLDPGPVLGDVTRFAWTPDGTRLVYAADEREDESFEVHAATLDPRSILDPIANVALGSGSVFVVSPTSAWVAFRAVPTCDSPPYCTPAAPLRGAPIDGSRPQETWSPTLGGFASSFAFDPGGGHVVFRQVANGYHYSASGLFSFPVHGGTEPVSLTEPPGMVLAETTYFSRFVLSPDGARVVFERNHLGEDGLWSVPIDRGLEPTRIAVLVNPGDFLDTFQVGPDGRWVFFVADLETPGIFELFRAPIRGGSPPEHLGVPVPPYADVDAAFRIHPDGTDVFFVADLEQDGVQELWSVPADPARGSVPVRISAKPLPGGGVALGRLTAAAGLQPQFDLCVAAGRVVYRSDEREPGRFELFSARLDGRGAPARLSSTLAADAQVPPSGFRVDPRGRRVVFAAPDGDGVLRLHSVPVDGGAPPVELGGPFVAGGGLWSHGSAGVELSFELTPDGATVVYLADQRADEVVELFAVPAEGSGDPRRLNGRLVAGGDVRLPAAVQSQAAFAISPDGRLVAYLADQHADEVFELFVSALEPLHVRPSDRPPAVLDERARSRSSPSPSPSRL